MVPFTLGSKVMTGVPGIADLAVFNSLGQPTVEVNVNRDRAARYGLATGDVNRLVNASSKAEVGGGWRAGLASLCAATNVRPALAAVRTVVLDAP